MSCDGCRVPNPGTVASFVGSALGQVPAEQLFYFVEQYCRVAQGSYERISGGAGCSNRKFVSDRGSEKSGCLESFVNQVEGVVDSETVGNVRRALAVGVSGFAGCIASGDCSSVEGRRQCCYTGGCSVGVEGRQCVEADGGDGDGRGRTVNSTGCVESSEVSCVGQSLVVEKEEVKVNVPGAFGNSCHEEESKVLGVVGANVERNRAWRREKKARKEKKKNTGGKKKEMQENWRNKKDPFSLDTLVRDQDIELRNSLAAKWKAENALAKLRAERQFAVLSSSDVQDEVKQHRTKLNANIERNMVSIEKTHATLRATGNVAGEFHGSAETVMTPGLSSGTISPDSSASMQEFRAVQKRNLDLENKIKIATEKLGVDIEHIDLYDKEIWTNNSVNEAILDKMYPDGYGMDGTFYDEGKVRVIPT